MQVKDLFFYAVDRRITTVIKVDDRTEAQMAEELREYIPTDAIERELICFLEAFVETRPGQPGEGTDDIGVWISGFFGSGKSHFAKIISYLVANPVVEGRSAHEWFGDRIAGSALAPEIKGLLVQLRNYLESQPIMFQIKAEQDLINPDSITEIIYRQYLRARGLSKTPWIGRLELELIELGKFNDFRSKVLELTGQPWEKARESYLLVRASIVRALREILPGRYTSDAAADRALDDIQENLRLAPTDLAQELAAYVRKRDTQSTERAFHLVFIIDEMGQFIGDDGQKLLELQSIAETFATAGGGRLWLIVTAQEALEEVVEGVRRRAADYARIMARFALKLKLTSEDVERVLEERILKKKEAVRPVLRDLHRENQGNLMDIANLEATRPIDVPDFDRFFRTYPFLPYHFDLMQQAFASLRAKGGSSTQLSGGERSMLGVTQGVLAAPGMQLADAQAGRLVRLDQLYDQIVKEVPGSDRRAINQVAEQAHAGAVHPTIALKALFVLQQVGWVSPTLENVTRVLADNLRDNLTQRRVEVKAALDVLVQQQYASVSGGEYKYLSAAERDIEQEIAGEPAKNADVRRTAREMLAALLATTGRLNYKSGTTTFEFRIVGDGQEIRSQGDITLQVYSPIYVEFGNVEPEIVRDVQSPHEEQTVYWLPALITSLTPDFRRMIQIQEVVGRRESRANLDPVEMAILRDKHRDVDLLKSRLQSAMRRALVTGAIVYLGDQSDLDGRTNNLNVIFNRELADVIPAVYTKFYMADVKVQERSIEQMLTTRPANLPDIEPDLHLWDVSGPEPRINTTSAVVSEILDELERRQDQGRDLSGRAVSGYFESTPYGWNPILVRVVLAGLFRAGRISTEFEGKRYTDPGLDTAQQALTRATYFRRARFLPEEGLTLEERRRAQQQLDILFDRKVDDTPNTLVTTLRQELSALSAGNERLQLQCKAVDLPVKDLLYEGRARVGEVLEEPDQAAQIRALLKAADELARLVKYQSQVAQFARDERLQTFVRAQALLTTVGRAQSYVDELQGPVAQDRLADMHHILREHQVIERWDHFHTCYQEVLGAYQQAYQRLFRDRSEAYRGIRDELAQFTDDIPRTVTAHIAENGPGYWTWADHGLHYRGIADDLTDLCLQIRDAGRVRAQSVEQIQVQQLSEKGNGETPKPQPVLVTLSAVVPHTTIQSRDQLKEVVQAIEVHIGRELDEGHTVILG